MSDLSTEWGQAFRAVSRRLAGLAGGTPAAASGAVAQRIGRSNRATDAPLTRVRRIARRHCASLIVSLQSLRKFQVIGAIPPYSVVIGDCM